MQKKRTGYKSQADRRCSGFYSLPTAEWHAVRFGKHIASTFIQPELISSDPLAADPETS